MFPEGEYDLVTASFLESLVDVGRQTVLQKAAALVTRGGVRLITSHGAAVSRADHWLSPFPRPDETRAAQQLRGSLFLSEILNGWRRD